LGSTESGVSPRITPSPRGRGFLREIFPLFDSEAVVFRERLTASEPPRLEPEPRFVGICFEDLCTPDEFPPLISGRVGSQVDFGRPQPTAALLFNFDLASAHEAFNQSQMWQ